MKSKIIIIILTLILNKGLSAEENNKIIKLTSINWEPFSGQNLKNHGFISEIVEQSFKKVNFKVEFHYFPWKRALWLTKNGYYHGLMDAYWSKDRILDFIYSDVVWRVKEDFISYKENAFNYYGTINSLSYMKIGALRGSLQHKELEKANVIVQPLADLDKLIKMFIAKRIKIILVPRSIFFYYLKKIDPKFDTDEIQIIKPSYKIYDMYVVFSRKKKNHKKLTKEFNRGLKLIKKDGTYEKIIKKHKLNLKN